MGNGDSHDMDIELKGDGALNIDEDALVIAYLLISEIPVGLTSKECDLSCIMSNGSINKVILSYRCGQMDKCE
jgi:hypothetical protein